MKRAVKFIQHATYFAAALFLFGSGSSDAAVIINIDEVGPDVVITASGTLLLPSISLGITKCGNGTFSPPPDKGAIDSAIAAICIGDSSQDVNYFPLAGSQPSFGSGPVVFADSFFGDFFGIEGNQGLIGSGYASGSLINSSSTFNTTTLAKLGISNRGVIGTWTVANTNDTITVRATPGPMGLLGLPIAYGWSRNIRRRIGRSAAK